MNVNNYKYTNLHGDTSLTLASKQGEYYFVRFLLEKGANVDERNNYGSTPLMYAVWNGHKDIISLLLTAGADVNLRNLNSDTALMYAVRSLNSSIVSLLLETGNIVNHEHLYNTLKNAELYGDTNIVSLLKSVLNLENSDESVLKKLFQDNPYLWTKVSKHFCKKAWDYFINQYSEMLNVSKDVMMCIFF